MSEAFKPRLTIGPWQCPHYKSFHQKDPLRCDDPHRLWLGLWPDGTTLGLGIAADKRGPYLTCKRSIAEAMECYRKKLSRRLKIDATKAKRVFESAEGK